MRRNTRIVLTGGPRTLVEAGVVELPGPIALDDKVKIAYASGYEHFTPSGEVRVVDGEALPVYAWCERTKIAE